MSLAFLSYFWTVRPLIKSKRLSIEEKQLEDNCTQTKPTSAPKPNQTIKSTGEEQLHEHTLFGPDGLYGSKEMSARLANTSYSAGPGMLNHDTLKRWMIWTAMVRLVIAVTAKRHLLYHCNMIYQVPGAKMDQPLR